MNKQISNAMVACLALAAGLLLAITDIATARQLTDKEFAAQGQALMFTSGARSDAAIEALRAHGKTDVVAALILALRHRRQDAAITAAISELTDTQITSWRDAMLWQEAHPEVVPHESFAALKMDVFQIIDPQFQRFLGGKRGKRENLDIRFEEITWGGVRVDGIPALDNPRLIPAADATFMADNDLVFAVAINGDVRAYPLRIMGWHEMFNETIGGVPVALAYCTLCGAGILFETKVEGYDVPFVFGSSGLLYRSNKLMFDRQTDSLWNQFTGEPVSGPLRGSGISLKIRPLTITTWANWKDQQPQTKVLSLDTGHRRNYGSGVVYQAYFASPGLMFPVIVGDETVVARKDFVFGIRDVAAARAWPVKAFTDKKIINDAIGDRHIVLIGDTATRTVRAFERNAHTFAEGRDTGHLAGPGGQWKITEDALVGPAGEKLARVPGHISYWFAWDGYLGIESTLFTESN